MSLRLRSLSLALVLTASSFTLCPPVAAQQTAVAPALLPDAPGLESSSVAAQDASPQAAGQQSQAAQSQPANTAPADAGPSKRLFFIIPNFRSVRTTVVLPPQTIGQKFSDASKDTFDYSAFVLEFILAGYSDATRSTPEFGHGGIAYGRYLWHASADQSIENYTVEFVVPALTHEDTRYYQLGHGGFKKRTWYAVTRTFVTKSDSNHEVANLGEIVGAAGSAAISQTYYPRPERSAGKFLTQYGTDLFIDAAAYFLREFEPEISRVMAHQKPAVSQN